MAGAEVEGEETTVEAGRDLTIASRQDSASSSSRQDSGGVGISVDVFSGAVSGSADIARQRGQAERAWVDNQTSIRGRNSVDIDVGGHTQIDGAVVTAPGGQVSIYTGTFGHSDIADREKSKDTGVSIGLSTVLKKGKGPGPDAGTTHGGIEGGFAETDKEGVSRATVGDGTITVRDEAGQKALEDSGATQKVAAINRDKNLAQEVTKDETTAFEFYASDTSVKNAAKVIKDSADIAGQVIDALAEAVKEAGDTLGDVLDGAANTPYERSMLGAKDIVVEQGYSEEEARQAAEEIHELAKTEDGRKEIQEMAAGGGRCAAPGKQGFNWTPLDLLVTPAHAAEPVTTTTAAVCATAVLLVAGAIYIASNEEGRKQIEALGKGIWIWATESNEDDENSENPRARKGGNNPPPDDIPPIAILPPPGDGNPNSTPIVAGGGLGAHENVGGHLIDRHVGKTDSDLYARLNDQPNITAASSFSDRATAERAVSSALNANRSTIANFVNGSTNRMVINHNVGSTVGNVMTRGSHTSVPSSKVRVVLQRDPSMSTGYRIVTGYPTP